MAFSLSQIHCCQEKTDLYQILFVVLGFQIDLLIVCLSALGSTTALLFSLFLLQQKRNPAGQGQALESVLLKRF